MADPEHIGKYEVVRLLGQGGFGEVFLVRHPELSVLRAVKLIRAPALTGGEGSGDRLQEAVLQAQLEHERIVQVMDVGVQQGRPFLVMEYLPGGSLDHVLAQGPLALPRALTVTRDLSQALAFAHERGVIHRDLKPANVLLNDDGRAKVADFGLARLLSAGGVHETKVAGTVSYLAPEQLGGKALPQSDLWALGCLIYEMLSGHPPFSAEGDYFTMKAIAETTPPPLAAPDGVLRLMDSLLAKNPDERPANARLVVEALERINGEEAQYSVPAPSRVQVTCEADDWSALGGGAGRTFAKLPALSQALKPLWSFEAESPILSSPAICRGKVCLGDNAGIIHCLDMFSGRSLWRHQAQAAAFPSPVAAGTALLTADSEGWLYALDSGKGELIWKARPGGKLAAGPVYTPEGVYLADLKGRLFRLDTTEGATEASWDLGAPVEGSPLPLGGAMVCAARSGKVMALNPSDRRGWRWSANLPQGVEASPAGAGGLVMVLDISGVLTCLQDSDGTELWRADMGGLGVAAPSTDGERVVCSVLEGQVCALEARTGRRLWEHNLGRPMSASPVMAGPMVVLADRGGRITLLDREDGHLISHRQLPNPFHSTPAVWRDLLVAADLNGTVHALGGS